MRDHILKASRPNPSGFCLCGCGKKTDIAKWSHARSGWIKGQPKRFYAGHNTTQNRTDIFQRYEVGDNGCWNWIGRLTPFGYAPQSKIGGKAKQIHRLFYEKWKGPIPDGLVTDHLCRNRRCVNPEHLEAVTVAENNRRGNSTKISEVEIDDILMFKKIGKSNAEIGRLYGFTRQGIRAIINRKKLKGD